MAMPLEFMAASRRGVSALEFMQSYEPIAQRNRLEALAARNQNGRAHHQPIKMTTDQDTQKHFAMTNQDTQMHFAMTDQVPLELPTAEEIDAIDWESWNPEPDPDYEAEDEEGANEDAEGSDDDGSKGDEEDDAEGDEDDDVEAFEGNDAEGVEDDDIEMGENGVTAQGGGIDSGFQSQAEDQQPMQAEPDQQPSQNQQKLYIRFSTKIRQAKQVAEAKKRDLKSLTMEKQSSITPIDEVTKLHGGGTASKHAKSDVENIKPKSPSSSAPPNQAQKRHASPVARLESEQAPQRAHKKAKITDEHGVENSPEDVLPPVGSRKQKQTSHPIKPTQEQPEPELASSPLPVAEPIPVPHRFSVKIPNRILSLYETLKSPGLQVLPELEHKGVVAPWNANRLTLLYIHSYIQDNIPLCDLIADVWIRAFQERNRSTTLPPMWTPNKAHVERTITIHNRGMKGFHSVGLPNVPLWQQKLSLPSLDNDVTDFNPQLLNNLYHYTAEANGARLLWADALALCGNSAEDWFLACKKEGIELHPDIAYNVMCTTLRSYRRRLTLKIEEVGKKKWCQRYHLHSKWALECHRETEIETQEDDRLARLQAAVEAHDAESSSKAKAENSSKAPAEEQDDLGAAIMQGLEDTEGEDDLGAAIMQGFDDAEEVQDHLGDAIIQGFDNDEDLDGAPTAVQVISSDGGESSEEE